MNTIMFRENPNINMSKFSFHIGNIHVTCNNVDEVREVVEELSQKLGKGEEYGKHISDFIFDVEAEYQRWHNLDQDDWSMLHKNNKMKKKAVFKFNSGVLALLCSGCSKILKRGFEFTQEEHLACMGKAILPQQYCNKCKQHENNLS